MQRPALDVGGAQQQLCGEFPAGEEPLQGEVVQAHQVLRQAAVRVRAPLRWSVLCPPERPFQWSYGTESRVDAGEGAECPTHDGRYLESRTAGLSMVDCASEAARPAPGAGDAAVVLAGRHRWSRKPALGSPGHRPARRSRRHEPACGWLVGGTPAPAGHASGRAPRCAPRLGPRDSRPRPERARPVRSAARSDDRGLRVSGLCGVRRARAPQPGQLLGPLRGCLMRGRAHGRGRGRGRRGGKRRARAPAVPHLARHRDCVDRGGPGHRRRSGHLPSEPGDPGRRVGHLLRHRRRAGSGDADGRTGPPPASRKQGGRCSWTAS